MQTPSVQVSNRVEFVPSLQGVPSGASGLVQTPFTQTPATWHESSGAQVTFWQGLSRPEMAYTSRASSLKDAAPASQVLEYGNSVPVYELRLLVPLWHELSRATAVTNN